MSEKHLTTEDFDYDLPESLIAQTPLEERDQSRMLILDSKTGEYQDDYFYNIWCKARNRWSCGGSIIK